MDGFDLNLANPGIALAILGYFGFIFKDIPARIWSLIQQRLSVTFNSSSSDNTYQFTMNWLISRFPDLKQHIQLTGYNSLAYTIADGTYFFTIDPFTYILINKFYIERGNYDGMFYIVKGQIIGLNRYKILKDYNDFVIKSMPDKNTHLEILYRNQDRYTSCIYSNKRSFDDIFLEKDTKSSIISIIDKFIQSYDYYKEHGITYKLGIMLSGKPGSGKSSIAKAIASYLGWRVYYINGKNNIQFDHQMNNTVILMEDIDCIIEESREKKEEKESHTDNQDKLSMHDLLNYLDGILSPSNCIFIATTNYPERIDPALIRPGRFDYHFTIDYADRSLAEQVCDRFGVDYDILDDIELPCSVSVIQNKIIMKR